MQTSWNASTNTIAITQGTPSTSTTQGQATKTTDFSSVQPYYMTNFYGNYKSTQNGANIQMAGVKYSDAIQLYGSNTFSATRYCWNLNDQYSTLTATLGLDDGSNSSHAIVTFEGDEKTIQTIQLSAGGLSQSISIPVSGVNQLTILIPITNAMSQPVQDYIDLANATLS